MIEPVDSSGSSSTGGTRFCSTEEIMRKIVPTTMKIDDQARQLIEKCVTEFACSITNIAGGYCSIDQAPMNLNATVALKPANVPGELKSEHIIRSLDNLGFSEYSKPLSTFKHVQKTKTVQQFQKPVKYAHVEPNQAKKQKGPNGAAVAHYGHIPSATHVATLPAPVARTTMPVPTSAVPHAFPNRSNLTPAQAFKQQQQDMVDQYLRFGSLPISASEIARTFHVSQHTVNKRVQALKALKVEMKGLKSGHQMINNNRAMPNGGGGGGSAATATKSSTPVHIVRTVAQPVIPAQVMPPTAPHINISNMAVSSESTTQQRPPDNSAPAPAPA